MRCRPLDFSSIRTNSIHQRSFVTDARHRSGCSKQAPSMSCRSRSIGRLRMRLARCGFDPSAPASATLRPILHCRICWFVRVVPFAGTSRSAQDDVSGANCLDPESRGPGRVGGDVHYDDFAASGTGNGARRHCRKLLSLQLLKQSDWLFHRWCRRRWSTLDRRDLDHCIRRVELLLTSGRWMRRFTRSRIECGGKASLLPRVAIHNTFT